MHAAKFSLQPALSYKQTLEERCQVELADLELSHGRAQSVLEALRELQRAGYEELDRQHAPGHLDVNAIATSFATVHTVQQRIEHQARLVRDLVERIEIKRNELIEICKGKKVLEKLKEKHEKQITEVLLRAENKAMEQIATSQFCRRKKAGSAA